MNHMMFKFNVVKHPGNISLIFNLYFCYQQSFRRNKMQIVMLIRKCD